MKRGLKFLRLAISEAEKSDHKQRVGAIIFKAKTVFSKGHNYSSKSVRSITKKFCRWPNSIHAEVDCILKAKRDLSGMNILIVRINKKGELRYAKPCRQCLAYLFHVSIRNVYYSTSYGTIEKIGLR